MIANYYAYKFIKLLTQDWTETDAYEFGFIDKDGNATGKKAKTQDEKAAYSRFVILTFNIKRMLDKVPFGKSTIGRYSAALALLREEFELDHIDSVFVENILTEDQYLFLDETNSIRIDEDTCYDMFGVWFDGEQLIENFTTGFDGVDGSLGTTRRKASDEDEGFTIKEDPDCSFAGVSVFDCDMDTFNNCRLGKKKFTKYKNYVGVDETGERIRQYSLKNPKKSVILRNKNTGAMTYLRKV